MNCTPGAHKNTFLIFSAFSVCLPVSYSYWFSQPLLGFKCLLCILMIETWLLSGLWLDQMGSASCQSATLMIAWHQKTLHHRKWFALIQALHYFNIYVLSILLWCFTLVKVWCVDAFDHLVICYMKGKEKPRIPLLMPFSRKMTWSRSASLLVHQTTSCAGGCSASSLSCSWCCLALGLWLSRDDAVHLLRLTDSSLILYDPGRFRSLDLSISP